MWGLDVWCESAGRARGHILHWSLNPLSLSARLGRFRIWKDIAPEFIGGYILREVQQLYIEEDMGGTWEVGAADLRRFHRADTYIERPSDKGLAYNGHSSSHQVKHNAIKIPPITNVCSKENLCLRLCSLSPPPHSQQFANYRSAVMTGLVQPYWNIALPAKPWAPFDLLSAHISTR